MSLKSVVNNANGALREFVSRLRPTVLIDGSGYIFRAFHAIAPLSTSKGVPVNATYGFTRMVLRLLSDIEPESICVLFDAGRKTFRNDIYPLYKAHRPTPPEDLIPQFEFFPIVCKALGLKQFSAVGYEADDLIGTLAAKLISLGENVLVVSGDKDLLQLVVSPKEEGSSVTIWEPMSEKIYDEEEVKLKWGILPKQIPDLFGLIGDSSDNIPGVKGVGPKTAVQLLERFGSVDNLATSAAELLNFAELRNRKKIYEAIVDENNLMLSKELATVNCEVPLLKIFSQDLPITAIKAEIARIAPDKEALSFLTEELEFKTIAKEIGQVCKIVQEEGLNPDFKTVFKKDFNTFLELLKEQKIFSIDLETTSLESHLAEIVGISFCFKETEAYYLPLAHFDSRENQVALTDALKELKIILEDENIFKVGQNLKYDISVLLSYDIDFKGIAFDSMIAAYLIDPDRRGFGLDALARLHLGRENIKYEDIVENGKNFASVNIAKATEYAAEDAWVAWQLYGKFYPEIKRLELLELLTTIELPLIKILAQIERLGIVVDVEVLKNTAVTCNLEILRLEKEIKELTGSDFNINSPKQLAEVMFDKLKIPTFGLKKTKTGISTDSRTLERIVNIHPLPKKILDYRTYSKLKTTYLDTLPKQITANGRIHTRLHQTIAATGRLSSSDPNLQNIPIVSKLGRKVRSAFTVPDQCLMLSADYSQIELRVLAHLSGDKALREAFAQNLDIHAKTAREILKIPPTQELTKEERRIGKVMNFGIIYGMGAFRLAKELEISVKEAESYINSYFAGYPKVKEYFSNLEQSVAIGEDVRTLFGRRRVLKTLKETLGSLSRDKGFITRAAINAPIQGTAADIVKLSMIKLNNLFEMIKSPARMLMQIHDELLFEIPTDHLAEVKDLIKNEMQSVVKLSVPLVVDVSIGRNWEEVE
jgi:DNA polymerase I